MFPPASVEPLARGAYKGAMTHRRALLLAAATLPAACAPAASETPDPSDPVRAAGADAAPGDSPACDEEEALAERATGGYVRLERFVGSEETRALALAELYTGHSGPGRVPTGYYGAFPEDTCFEVPLAPAEPSFYDFVDLGPSIELSGPAAISLPREALFDNIFYRAAALEGTLVAGADYEVAAGEPLGTLRMPPQPTLTAPAGFASGQVVLSDLSIAWEPTGAAALYLVFQQDSVGRVCRLRDDGAFTVPEDTALMVPAWGTMALIAIDRRVVDVRGLRVELVGTHGVSASYERQP